jgi:hypothetical protein
MFVIPKKCAFKQNLYHSGSRQTCNVGSRGDVVRDEERLLLVLVVELLDGDHPPDPAPGQRRKLQRLLRHPPLVLDGLPRKRERERERERGWS